METLLDLDQLAEFLEALHGLDPARDDKLRALVELLRTDPTLQANKVLVFTEYVDTARYLERRLKAEGIGPLDEVDSHTRRDRSAILRAFSPYYNGSSSSELGQEGLPKRGS